MPELPDIVVYIERLEARVIGSPLEQIRLASPWVLRTFEPPVSVVAGKQVTGLRRIGKRIVLELEENLFVVIHLMVAGRLRWRDHGAASPKKRGLAAFDFEPGTVLFTEEGTKTSALVEVPRAVVSSPEPMYSTGPALVIEVGRYRVELAPDFCARSLSAVLDELERRR